MSAIQGVVSKFMSLADGTLRVQIDIHQTDTRAALELLCEVGRPLALAALADTPAAEVVEELTESEASPHYLENECDNSGGKLMQALYRGGWFHAPKVLEALGVDAGYLQWVRMQEQCQHCSCHHTEDNEIVAAHYRKVGTGAGVGTKPPFSAVTLCSKCHTLQHGKGYEALAPLATWERWVAETKAGWGHQRMREIFETESMAAIPAKWVVEWALEHELNAFIPKEFLT